jgi:hypothetical protein
MIMLEGTIIMLEELFFLVFKDALQLLQAWTDYS